MSGKPLTHYGDPCVHCSVPHDEVPVGPCQGDAAKAVPIAWCPINRRWDNVIHYRLLYSDGRIEDHWEHNDLMNYLWLNSLPTNHIDLTVLRGLP